MDELLSSAGTCDKRDEPQRQKESRKINDRSNGGAVEVAEPHPQL